ncbi:TPA: hypothetical protein RPG34_003380 [Yersinia enterocolitica]|nr:hypothetical protein [Yersinia enterocolitica]
MPLLSALLHHLRLTRQQDVITLLTGLHNLVISSNADMDETEQPENELNHSPANNSADAAKNNE